MMKMILGMLVVLGLVGCGFKNDDTEARSGVHIASVKVPVDPSGMTTEQHNIQDRLILDNKPGSTKHLYVISAYSGDVLLYSTVRGKVTSSGKRLSPPTKTEYAYQSSGSYHPDLIQDDGTYGSSVEYLFWWDEQGRYHQHYVNGGQILHISDQPISFPKVIVNISGEVK